MNALDDHTLRSELDAMFRRRETDVGPTFTLPRTIRTRVRLRRAARTSAAVIAILGIVGIGALSLAGLRGLVGRSGGTGPASGLEGAAVLTSGESDGVRWTASVRLADGVPCTEIEMGGEVAGGCWPDISDAHPSAQLDVGVHGLGQPGGPRWRRFTFLTAVVPRSVADVVVLSDAGVFRSGDPVEPPEEWGDVRVAVVPIEERTSAQLASSVLVRYLDGDGRSAYPDEQIRLREVPELAISTSVPEYVTSRISSIGGGADARTLFAWQEEGTSKFGVWLEGPGGVLGVGATTEFVASEPFLSIRGACARSAGIVWGTVPASVAAVDVGLVAPDRIESIAGPSGLGDVRFVLGSFEEPYPDGAPVTYLDAAGDPIGTDWPGGAAPGCDA